MAGPTEESMEQNEQESTDFRIKNKFRRREHFKKLKREKNKVKKSFKLYFFFF